MRNGNPANESCDNDMITQYLSKQCQSQYAHLNTSLLFECECFDRSLFISSEHAHSHTHISAVVFRSAGLVVFIYIALCEMHETIEQKPKRRKGRNVCLPHC